jgi:Holliday junction resolvase RusA-like endonuclease
MSDRMSMQPLNKSLGDTSPPPEDVSRENRPYGTRSAAEHLGTGRRISFGVRGVPVPQGALVRSPHGGLYHRDAKRLDAWRGAIAVEAADAVGDNRPMEGPVAVAIEFVLPRPQSHYLPANGRRSRPLLRADAPEFVSGPPDVDKLCRALLDALTAVVIRDDGQVASVSARKVYETDDRHTGCRVSVRPLEFVL